MLASCSHNSLRLNNVQKTVIPDIMRKKSDISKDKRKDQSSRSAQVVPRIWEFSGIRDIISCCGNGSFLSKRGVRRSTIALHKLMSSESRRELFDTPTTEYRNSWWAKCHESAY